MIKKKLLVIHLFLIGLSLSTNQVKPKNVIDIDYVYSAANELDGDFVISQLVPEILSADGYQIALLTFPIGEIDIIKDSNDNFICHGKDYLCETNMLHFCIEEKLKFLSCYFQSELFPVDLIGATKQCYEQINSMNNWDDLIECANDTIQYKTYMETTLGFQQYRPLTVKTPYIFLNDKFSPLAAIDLKKAICREQSTNIWDCKSIDQYKEPLVEIFYTPYDKDSETFFEKHLTDDLAQRMFNTSSEVDIIPNLNNFFDCKQDCWRHQAHWCIYENYAGLKQVQIIKCSFHKSNETEENRIRKCVDNDQDFTDITVCMKSIDNNSTDSPIFKLKERLNQLIEQSSQQSIEVLINGVPNVKAKNGIVQELCYNYFTVDNETLGCAVNHLPSVSIYYETQLETEFFFQFMHLLNFAPLAPFETIAQFEFVPYGNTSFFNGTYTCPKGEDQCNANWVHACLFKQRYNSINKKFQFLQFFICSTPHIKGTNAVNHAAACVNQFYDDGPNLWIELLPCAHSDHEIRERLRNRTDSIQLSHIPEIEIDGQLKTNELNNDLLLVLCRSFKTIKPRACFEIDTNTTQMLDVSIYLSADKNAQEFVKLQLKPLLENNIRDPGFYLRDVIRWQFIPWGFSTYNQTSGTVQCVHGDNECLANRILTCAGRQRQNGRLSQREDRQRVAKFVVCFFGSSDWQTKPMDVANKCAPKLSPLDTFPQLRQCAVQDIKLKYLLDMKRLTENNYPPISNFPEVSINQQRQDNAAIDNLVKFLCNNYKAKPAPNECQNSSASLNQISIYNLLLIILVIFTNKQSIF